MDDENRFASGDTFSSFIIEGMPYLERIGDENSGSRWNEIFPGIWVWFWEEEFTDEEILPALSLGPKIVEGKSPDFYLHLLRVLEGRSRSTCSGRLCQLVLIPRETERFMLDEKFWEEPREVHLETLKAIFTSFNLSLSTERIRIIGETNFFWNNLNPDLYPTSWYGDFSVYPVGLMLRYEHLIGDKPPKSLDFEEWEEAVQRCWCAGLHMLTGENGLGFEKFVACYEEIIDTFIAEERLIIGLRALEAIFPIEGDKGIRETLMRRIATVRASFSEQGGMNENYEEDYPILREMIGDFVSLANKIKHNINLSEKDFEDMTEKFHFGISALINDLFFIIVELGKLPSPDEIDQGVENGVSMDFPSKLPFSEYQFYNSTFRWDMAFDSEKIRQFNSIGGLSVSTYQEFLDEHHPVIAWEDIPEASPWESSEIDRGTVSRHGTFSQEPKKDSGPSERTSVELPESSENEEEPLVIFPIVLLGVPIVIDEDGDEEPWIEVFPGLRITWSDKVYEDHEIRRRCSDQHGFHEFKLLEIMSRETCGGYVCELEVDTEVAKELLEETGRGHLKEAVNEFSLYAIFRLFIVVFPGFSGVRLTNTYNRDWESLLDEWWDDHDVKIIPQTGIWTKLLNQYQKWPHKPFERVPSIDIGSLSNFWRAAIICLEDYLKGGRIFKSLDEPASAFLHSGTLEEKNSNFIIILSTLLGKHRSKDLTTAQIVSFIGSRWLWELENDDEAKSYFSDVVSNSINLRNDTAHGRFPSPKFLQETTDLQHDVLMRIYATIIHHGGIPSKDLVHSGLKGEDLVFNREWEDPIPLDIIRDDVSRWQ